jgi:hypothetical protein
VINLLSELLAGLSKSRSVGLWAKPCRSGNHRGYAVNRSGSRPHQYGTSLICSRLRKALLPRTVAFGVLSRRYINIIGGPFIPDTGGQPM